MHLYQSTINNVNFTATKLLTNHKSTKKEVLEDNN